MKQRSPLIAVHGSWRRTISYVSVSARAKAQSCAGPFLPILAWKILRLLCLSEFMRGLPVIDLEPVHVVGASCEGRILLLVRGSWPPRYRRELCLSRCPQGFPSGSFNWALLLGVAETSSPHR